MTSNASGVSVLRSTAKALPWPSFGLLKRFRYDRAAVSPLIVLFVGISLPLIDWADFPRSKLRAKAGRRGTLDGVGHPAPPIPNHIAIPQPFDGPGHLT